MKPMKLFLHATPNYELTAKQIRERLPQMLETVDWYCNKVNHYMALCKYSYPHDEEEFERMSTAYADYRKERRLEGDSPYEKYYYE